MSLKLKRDHKILLFSLITFIFIFFASYQGNMGIIVPSSQSQSINSPDSERFRPLEKYYLWADNGTPVCTYMLDQLFPRLVSDGSGGAIILWTESNFLVVQKVLSDGSTSWGASSSRGIRVSMNNALQQTPIMSNNGEGGAIIAWQDSRNATNDNIWIQNMASDGSYKWVTSDGLPLSLAPSLQTPSDIINDGITGAIVVWSDLRNGVTRDIYAQRINDLGAPLWRVNGLPISNASLDQSYPRLCSDGVGGAIIVWEDQRAGNWDIYAQRILSTGVLAWTPNGTKICTLSGDQRYPIISSDGAGGAVIIWTHGISNHDIYAQRVNSAGVTQWTANGTIITNAASSQIYPVMTPDTLGGYIIAWGDTRNGNWDIYAQRINSSGQSNWTVNGIPICNKANQQSDFRICSDGHGGAYITWIDYRTSTADIYAQLINFLGQAQYQRNGTAVCNATNTQGNPNMVNDGSDGAIITWGDLRNGGDYNIYAQRMKYIDSSGPLAPTVSSPSHPNLTGWYSSLDVSVQWSTPVDVSGVFNYLYQYDQNPLTIPSPINNSAITANYANFTLPTEGTCYFHVRANDTWGNLGDTAHFKVNIDSSPPQGSNPDPPTLSFVNNPSPDVSIALTDSLSGINESSLQMRVLGSPVSIDWTAPILTGFLGGYSSGDTINVEVDAQDNAGNPITYAWSFTIDLDPPAGSNPTPMDLVFVKDSLPDVSLDLTDAVSGVNSSSIVMRVNGEIKPHTWDGTRVNWTAPSPYSSGTNLAIQVDAKDNAGNTMGTYSWSFVIDVSPPVAFNPDPVNNSYVSDPYYAITITLIDYHSRVQESSIILTVEGVDYVVDYTTLQYSSDMLTFNTPVSFTDGQVVNMALNGADNVGNIMPTYEWAFTVDLFAPEASDPRPANLAITNNPRPNIALNLTDLLSGIRASSILMQVNGTPVMHTWNGVTVNWTSIPGYASGTLLNVQVDAEDNAGNLLIPVSWSFRIDYNPPILGKITYPLYGANISGTILIQGEVADDVRGTGVAFVELYDGVPPFKLIGNSTAFSFAWFTGTETPGLHMLYLRVYDFAQNIYQNATGVPIYIDNAIPYTACINSPLYNANLTGSVTMTAKAADDIDGTGIKYVEFYDNASSLGFDYWAPYSFTWSPAEGLHRLTMCAYDFASNMLNNATAVPIHIDNTNPILARVTIPVYNANITGGLTVTAIASDNNGGTGIWYVELWDGAVLRGTDYWAPYQYSWMPTEGLHTLTVRAYDFAGCMLNNATGYLIHVDNTNPILTRITAPVYNANVTGGLTVMAIAADNGGGTGIRYVEFYDGVTLRGMDYWAPYQYSWMPTEGLHMLTVRAYDFAGRVLNNATGIPIHIDNSNPITACIISPIYNANISGAVTITAIAADNGGGTGIWYVEFWDGALLGIDYWAPYQYIWAPSEGLHTLIVRAYDFTGHVFNNITGVPIHVDNSPPSLDITFPIIDGLSIFGRTIWLNGTASDPNTMVTSIECNDSRFDLYKVPTAEDPTYAFMNNSIFFGVVQVRINATDVLGYVQNVTRWFNSISVPTPNVIITIPSNGGMINPSRIWLNGTTEAGIEQVITNMLISHPSFTSAINLTGLPSGTFGYYNTSNIADGEMTINISTVNGLGRIGYALVTFTLDTVAPVASSPTPNLPYITTPVPNIALNLTDSLSGIDASSIQMHVNGDPVLYTWNGLTINWIASPAFLDGQVVLVTVDVDDKAHNAMATFTWSFTVDLIAPEASNPFPGNNSFVNDLTPNIAVELYDFASGINASSLIMRVNGKIESHTWDGMTISWISLIDYSDNSVNNVSIDACDNVGHVMPTCRWEFRIDVTPPVASGETPASVSYINDPTPEIRLTVTDSFAGVNGSSIVMRINGTPVGSAWDGTNTSFNAGPYASGTKLDITVDACDNAGNALPTKSWSFFIDTAAPLVNVVVPNIWAIYASGVELNILWTASDVSLCTIIIEYSINNGSSWQEISGSYSHTNDGSELWTLPSVDAALCLVHIHAIDSVGLTSMDQSDNAFLIFNTYPSATIIAPTLGGVIKAGVSSNIVWTSSTGVSPRTVSIEYSQDNGQNWLTIAAVSYDDGSEPWSVPLIDSNQCRIRINVTDQALHTGSSVSGLFAIDQLLPTCAISFAVGNPTFTGGSTQFILWSSYDLTAVTIKIEYSLDSGGHWQEINDGAYSHSNDNTEAWTIPSVDAENCLVRINATDAAGHSTVDITGFFSIIKPELPNDSWIYYVIIGAAVAGVVITALYMRSRKPAVSGPIQKPKWIAGMEATFPAEMALMDKIEMIISKGIPLEDILDPEIKKLLETTMGGLSLEVIEMLRKLPIPMEELRQIIAELSTLSPEEQLKFIEDLSKSMAN